MRASGYNWKRLDISWGKLAIDLGLYWSKFLFSTSSILLKVVWNIPIEEGLQREEDLGCPSSFLVKSAVLDPSADVDASGKGRIVSNRMLVPLLGTSTGWCWPEAVVLFNRRLARWSFAFIIITDLNIIYLRTCCFYCGIEATASSSSISSYAPFWWVWKGKKCVQILVRKGANRMQARNTIEMYWQYWYIWMQLQLV